MKHRKKGQKEDPRQLVLKFQCTLNGYEAALIDMAVDVMGRQFRCARDRRHLIRTAIIATARAVVDAGCIFAPFAVTMRLETKEETERRVHQILPPKGELQPYGYMNAGDLQELDGKRGEAMGERPQPFGFQETFSRDEIEQEDYPQAWTGENEAMWDEIDLAKDVSKQDALLLKNMDSAQRVRLAKVLIKRARRIFAMSPLPN